VWGLYPRQGSNVRKLILTDTLVNSEAVSLPNTQREHAPVGQVLRPGLSRAGFESMDQMSSMQTKLTS
jgi:hypothetical protein